MFLGDCCIHRQVDSNDLATYWISVQALFVMFQNKSFITTQVSHMQNFDDDCISLQCVG